MITVWGDRQTGSWEAVAAEDDFSPNVVYQFNYTIPEKPWWAFLLPWISWPINPKWLRDGIVKAIAAQTEISEDEIKVLWFSYDADTNEFKIQIKWIPSEIGAIPAAGVPLPIAVIIAAISPIICLFIIGRIIEKLAPDTIEKLVEAAEEIPEEIVKGIKWLTILAGVLVAGSLISHLIPRRKA